VQICYLTLGVSSDEQIAKIRDTIANKGRGDPSRIISEIRALLEALGLEVEAHKRG
jgi:hypothetical protein